MSRGNPNIKGLFVTSSLFLITIMATIWLFYYLTEPGDRSSTFGFTLRIICFLEILWFGYVAALMIRPISQRIAAAVYPAIGLSIGIYSASICFVVIFFSGKIYHSAIVVISVLFLLITGALIVLNIYNLSSGQGMEKTKLFARDLFIRINDINNRFLTLKDHFSDNDFEDIKVMLSKLKDSMQYGSDYGSNDRAVAEIEAQILSLIDRLEKSLLNDYVNSEEIKALASKMLNLVENREKAAVI